MGSRLKLQEELEKMLGSKNVYFQPPPSLKMNFPCIVYERVRINTQFADNNPYHLQNMYQISYIGTNPDSDMPTKIANLPMCIFERYYVNDNKYYNVFRIAY